MIHVPLAERLRPSSLDDVIGQEHILMPGGLLRELVVQKKPFSLLFWGPPGSGKTTLARILANEMEAAFVELSAVTAGKADVKQVVETASVNQRLGQQTVLFVDEIHRFNKAQQDAFLPYVENGLITLIGATTENPSFEIISPLLSRSRVLVLKPLSEEDIVAVLERARRLEHISKKILPISSTQYLAKLSGGDARRALSTLELACIISKNKTITTDTIDEAAQQNIPGYDKAGDMHFDVISAFIKSLRGSDSTATLYYLARMLQAGEDPTLIARRMIVFASEDIGIAASGVLQLTIATFQAVERVGMPECQYNLFHCAFVLSRCKKSRLVTDLMVRATSLAKDYPNAAVPLAIRNAPTSLMQSLGYNKDYKWEADFQPENGFLPDELKGLDITKQS